MGNEAFVNVSFAKVNSFFYSLIRGQEALPWEGTAEEVEKHVS